jgi:hypothetical protein
MHFIRSLIIAIIALIPLGMSGVYAAPVLASATRTAIFSSSSTAATTVPLRNNGSTTLQFETTAANQTVVIIYNAECQVIGARGTRLSLKIFVDGVQPEPSVGADFSLCSAVDVDGQTWVSATRQSVMKVPDVGNHVVTIEARLLGGTGTWELDDSSLVVQPALPSFATRENVYQSTSTDPTVLLPLKDNDGTNLSVATTQPNERVKVTYNAECVLAAGQAGKTVQVRIYVPDADVVDATSDVFCGAVDTTGKTWAGTVRQFTAKIPDPGNHGIKVQGFLNVGPGTWRLNDSALVVTKGFLASSSHENGLTTVSTDAQPVPLKQTGDQFALNFNTTQPNQVVKLSFNAVCQIAAARGRRVGIRIEVDTIQAAPASGFDFTLCSSMIDGFFHYVSGFRQSVITVPTAGSHEVRVFAKLSGVDPESWGVSNIVMVVE